MSERADKDLALRERFEKIQQAVEAGELAQKLREDRVAALEEKVQALSCELSDQACSAVMRVDDLECRVEELARKMPGA
ncbi:hypothetical protein [Halomonas elongata]|uniref:hypothetical protein n=1 Tax=Halomonas elongata TaxID=2746 RepID=UPI0023B0D828|nr:hypothetical protein [Halomonas elongata]